jgi:hypothetical protein
MYKWRLHDTRYSGIAFEPVGTVAVVSGEFITGRWLWRKVHHYWFVMVVHRDFSHAGNHVTSTDLWRRVWQSENKQEADAFSKRLTDEASNHDEDKSLEQSWMVLKDQYSELARAIGFEGDSWFGDPLAEHDEVLKRANEFAVCDWQTIETAPSSPDIPVLLLGTLSGEIYGDDDRVVCVVGSRHTEGGCFHLDGADYYSVLVRPTHWMPLPKMPSTKGGLSEVH